MFSLLTWVLLWLLVATIVYYLLVQFIPKQFLTWLGGIFLFLLLVGAFFYPNNNFVSSVWSIFSFPLKPLGLSLVLLMAALKNGVKKVSGNLVFTALIILLISSVPILAYQIAQQVEQEAILLVQQIQQVCQVQCPDPRTLTAAQRPGAIVLIGQGTTQANIPLRTQIQLTDTGDRILYTAQLYREQVDLGNNPLVIVSAGPRPELEGDENNVVEARDIGLLLERIGVPSAQIIREPTGVDLYTSAAAVDRVLRNRNIRDRPVILVTSAVTIRRANLTFSKFGIKVIPRPTNFYTIQGNANPRRRLRVADFIPSVEALVITTRVIEEYLTYIYYFLRGFLAPAIL